jgi:hypothetical protein
LKHTFDTDPQTVLEQFRPFLAPLYEAFEGATLLAYELISHYDWGPSPQLFSHMVRAHIKKTLNGKSCPVEYDDTTRIVQMDAVSMEGLATTIDDIKVKILKGEILPPPLSDARQFFYQHSNFNLYNDNTVPEIGSLVVLWECDTEGKNFRMYLACPRDSSGDWLWQIVIPPPAEWMELSSRAPLDAEPDLSISKEEPRKKSG